MRTLLASGALALISLAACESFVGIEGGGRAPASGPTPQPFSFVGFGTSMEEARALNGPPDRVEQKADTTVWIYLGDDACRPMVGRVLFVDGATVRTMATIGLPANCPSPDESG